MKLISHRGNIIGRNKFMENKPTYIDLAIYNGFDVEVDVWFKDNILYLGHDNPQYKVPGMWLISRKDKLWIHCKNIKAVSYISSMESDVKYFWHQEDDVSLVSNGYLWTYPGKQLTPMSIAVLPETVNYSKLELSNCYGICSDNIHNYIGNEQKIL